jgi:exosortase/archaeosortase family protein
MKKERKFFDIVVRYLILLVIGIIGTSFFYSIFTVLTVKPVYFLLGLFFNPSLASNIIIINNLPIEIIGACVAGSAYYLLLILNLSIPQIKIIKRIKIILFSFSLLLIANILRIFLLSVFYVSNFSFFDFAHKLFWYIGSTIIVAGIWFLTVKVFKIKDIPLYSDIKYLLNPSGKNIKNSKSSKRH